MGEPILDVKDLDVRFRTPDGEVHAVKGVSFHVEPGETLAIVGESGSGKSQATLAIMGLLASNGWATGSATYQGRELVGLTQRQLNSVRGRHISMIFQEPMTSLDPLYTIEKQIAEPLMRHRGVSRRAARPRVLELLKLVQIPEPERRLKAFPHELSGGQRQRVMIAMALANEPDILIADEPTTALDVTVQAQILELLDELKRENGLSMLFITHDLGIVRRIADEVAVMKDGRIVEAGETARVFDAPAHDYTRHLLAAEPKGTPPARREDAPVLLSADDLKVWFPIRAGVFRRTVGHVKAVDGITVRLRQGQTLGVVGESGSGKTTLGLALLRLIESDGPIVFLGKDIAGHSQADMRPLREDLQIVFQDPFGSLSPRMSIAEIIAEGLKIHRPGWSAEERDARVVTALEEVGLDPEARHRYPHEFSGGQRQRISIARAMVLNPRFVMLDEPTSALDMSVQAQVVDLLRETQARRDLAFLFISHDLKVVRALANDVIVMRAGKVIEEGPAETIFDNASDPYTRALMAAAFENKVAGEAAG